jgi:hypothetical protein
MFNSVWKPNWALIITFGLFCGVVIGLVWGAQRSPVTAHLEASVPHAGLVPHRLQWPGLELDTWIISEEQPEAAYSQAKLLPDSGWLGEPRPMLMTISGPVKFESLALGQKLTLLHKQQAVSFKVIEWRSSSQPLANQLTWLNEWSQQTLLLELNQGPAWDQDYIIVVAKPE